ncbi:channel protein TolC [Leptospira kobayashii]|uniref:Channel protein TolC n=1 Tax=Leptospira kobayashii TaxID=1917830 RepID=A0ABM7UL14_9LEPT|nr:TolC family protein [Leptospira kobayashii]BDA79618.1 channel protein TolC [Leptospira kobayashii]
MVKRIMSTRWKWKKKHSINYGLLILLCPLVLFSVIKSEQAYDPLSLSLEEAEVVGITNSVILQSLKDRREVFKMISTEKWRNYLPRVGVSYFGLKNNNINQSDSQYNDIRLQINQLLYDGGENKLEIESATLQELINQEDWKITKDKLSLEIRKTYIKSLANQVKLHLVKKTLERTLSQINDIKKENAMGFATELQRLEIESKIREIELLLLKTESNNNQANIELRKTLNLPLELPLRLKESLLNDYVLLPPYFKEETSSLAVVHKPEIKKSQITIENLKTRKEITENYWKPKVFLGSYYGQNINGPLPVKNDVYGFSISFQTQLGSTTNQSTANYGMQTDGTGIQRIPGFGPQFVGRGENAFNSSTLNLFDDLSYSRKIYEGKIALSDAIRNNQLIEIALKAEAFKAREKVREAWQVLRLTNSRFYITYETWKSMQAKSVTGFSKKTEMLSAELELLKSADDLTTAISSYLESVMDLSFATGVDVSEWQFYMYKKGEGNSLLAQLYSDDSFIFNKSKDLSDKNIFDENDSKPEKGDNKRRKKSEYDFYLED